MSSPVSFKRPARRRSTHPVLSDLPGRERWWLDPSTASATSSSRQKRLHFRSGDPFDRFVFVRYLSIAFSLIVPLIVLKATVFRPTGVSYDWSANPMQEVQRTLHSGQQFSAFQSLKAAVERSPGKPELLRALAALASEVSPAEARRCYHRLNSLGLTTDADCAGHAALLAKLHDFTGAKAVLSNISKQSQTMPQALYAWLAIWREVGDFAAAAATMDKLTAQVPCDVEIAADLVRKAAAASTPPDILQRLEDSLLKSLHHSMSAGRAQDVLALAGKLTALPLSSIVHRTHMAQILRNLPGAPVEYRLAAVRFGLPDKLETADQQQLRTDYQNEIAWSGGLSAEDKDRVASYLQSQGEHALVTTLISERESLTEPQLFSRRFDSLLELGQWREAGSMTASSDAPLLPHSRNLTRTLATLQDRSKRTFTIEILLAETLASSRQEGRALDCYATGCAALDHTLLDLAATSFATALDISKDRSKTMQAILRSSRQGHLPLGLFMRSLIGSPAMEDESIQDSLIYLSLLTGEKADSLLALVRHRRQQTPDNVYLRFLESFALHQQGSHEEALKLLIPLPHYRWHQGEAAVLASIIASAGQIDRSSPLIQQIDTSLLFPEEHTHFDPWRSRLEIGTSLASSTGAE